MEEEELIKRNSLFAMNYSDLEDECSIEEEEEGTFDFTPDMPPISYHPEFYDFLKHATLILRHRFLLMHVANLTNLRIETNKKRRNFFRNVVLLQLLLSPKVQRGKNL